jgi:hypothetical protein
MNSKTLIGLAAAGFVAIATMAAAAPGNALACSGGLGENCAELRPRGLAPLGLTGTASVPLPALVSPGHMAPRGAETPAVRLAGGGCGGAAAQAAASQGGQVIGSPKVVKRGNKTMCVVTVLIKDPKGKKPPTRRQVTVPAN